MTITIVDAVTVGRILARDEWRIPLEGHTATLRANLEYLWRNYNSPVQERVPCIGTFLPKTAFRAPPLERILADLHFSNSPPTNGKKWALTRLMLPESFEWGIPAFDVIAFRGVTDADAVMQRLRGLLKLTSGIFQPDRTPFRFNVKV